MRIKIFLLFLFSFSSSLIFAQDDSLLKLDSIFKYQDSFEDYVRQIETTSSFNVNEEYIGQYILDSREKLKSYIIFLMATISPEAKFSTIFVSEDKTHKIWFAYTQIENSLMGNAMQFIVCKSNCKVLLADMDR